MKYYLLAALLVTLTSLVIILVPIASEASEKVLVSTQVQVPTNSAKVLGIQNYSQPPVSQGLLPPSTTARSSLVIDLGTNSTLYNKNDHERVPIASTTKIMTALVGLDYYQQNTVLTAGDCASVDGSRVGLISGEQLTFRSMLYGMLLNSGNDAAFCIGENYPGGIPGFVTAMNNKAYQLGLLNTHFDNPAGFDSPNHYSSAQDLAKMAEEALKNPILTRVVATKETTITSVNKVEVHQLVNLNKLLFTTPGVIGVKTGSTPAAKENLITLIDRGGHRVLIVMLGSDDRFGETSALIGWTYHNFSW